MSAYDIAAGVVLVVVILAGLAMAVGSLAALAGDETYLRGSGTAGAGEDERTVLDEWDFQARQGERGAG